MGDTTKKRALSLIANSKAILELAKTAHRNRHSLSGTGFYANKFHDLVVKLTTDERDLLPQISAIDGFDSEPLKKNISTLRSTASDVRARDVAVKNIQLICQVEILPTLKNLGAPAVPAKEGVLPASVLEKAPGYLKRIVLQANGCYEQGWYDACSVMIRKLVESLIIEVYEKHGKGEEIKKDGDYLMLAGLIQHILNTQKHWSLQRETKRELPELKKLGDRAAHNRRYQATKQDIDHIRPGLRVMVDDFLHIAGFK